MKTPIVTNTTLNVIRLFGKYLHMLDTFEIISTDVINYMMQLFNFYFYYIYFNFAKREVSCFKLKGGRGFSKLINLFQRSIAITV